MKKELQRKLSFVLFVMAVFFAGMALTIFRDQIGMVGAAGVLLLVASVFYVQNRQEENDSSAEKATELLLADRIAEVMRGNEKAEKGVYIAVKKQHEAMENGMVALQEQIAELVKAQEQAVKTLVMYNKENAKQMALSEREELGRLREELKLLQKEKGAGGSVDAVVDAVREMSHRLYEEIHDNGEAVLAELGTTLDSLEEIKEVIEALGTHLPMMLDRNPIVREEEPEEEESYAEEPEDITAYFPEESEDETEPEVEPMEEPVDIFADSGVDLSDPNKALSADDIAALFAQANAVTDESTEARGEYPEPIAEEPVIEEITAPVAEEKPEDALASSGVDLTDPNKTLSADDIAALFAAMGN